jgi:hypothetical protein
MSSSDRPLTGAFWAQVVPTHSRYWSQPTGVKIIRITQRKPRDPEPGCLLIRIHLSVPAAAFVAPEHECSLEITEHDGLLVPSLALEPLGASDDGQ